MWDILEKFEFDDSIVIEKINTLVTSDSYPAFGLVDNNFNFLIKPKFQFISPLLEDNKRNCVYKKKMSRFDENSMELIELD